MKRTEALALQERVLARGLHRLGERDALPGRGGEARVESAASLELAVGIRGDGDDFRLAVRSPRDGDDVRQAVRDMENVGPVDFQVVGPIVALSKPWHQSKVRPLWPGASAAYHRVDLGTLGCFVARRNDPDRWPHILSNNHVLARERDNPNPRPREWIFQPAAGDDEDPDGDTVAQLSHWVPLQDEDNVVDAAIARLDEGIAWQPDVLDGLGTLQGVRPEAEPLRDDETVHKIGRTTGTTTGRVQAQEFRPVTVKFRSKKRSFVRVFEIESETEPFADHGDSGSLIVDDQLRAVGLLFATATEAGTTYANPIHSVLDLLEVDILLDVTA